MYTLKDHNDRFVTSITDSGYASSEKRDGAMVFASRSGALEEARRLLELWGLEFVVDPDHDPDLDGPVQCSMCEQFVDHQLYSDMCHQCAAAHYA